MLQAIRNRASSIFVKILFGLLVISFAIWGIGDIFRNHGTQTTVATVGDHKIDQQTLNRAVRQDAERWRQALNGSTLDDQQLKQLGIVDTALQRLIDSELTDLEIRHMGLDVSEQALDDLIRSSKGFHNAQGQFDPQLYLQFVEAQHMTPQQFKASLRNDIARENLDRALVDGVTPPPQLVDTLYRARAEKRTAEAVALPSSAAPDPGTPSDAEINDFYAKHKTDFRVPELRSFSLGVLTIDDVAAGIKVPDDKLHEEYQNRLNEFQAPEQRHFQQILLTDEGKAKAAAAELAQGKDFATVAKDVAGAAPDTLDLGFFKQADLPPDLAKPAFSLKPGETTTPIHDSLGWHILKLIEVKPASTEPFDQVKAKLAKEISRDQAGDRLAKIYDQLEDALAGGANFASVAQRFNLKVTKVENIDANGHDADGKPVDLPVSGADVLKTAFSTDSGQMSSLNDLGENGYYVLQVDKVTPASVKPLDQVKPQVVDLWQQQKRDASLAALAKGMADAVKSGKTLAAVAAEHKLTPFTTKELSRAGGDQQVPPSLVASLFDVKPGQAVYARSNDGYVVAVVKDVIAADPAKDPKGVDQFADRLVTPGLRDDILSEFDKALRSRYPVSIDRDAVSHAF
ncbi:MAG TPA: peptidyl-prolyl cis-trans isomerase [Stellaceae bacterium]|nr:peptidyl-prolyl cis-trans isomerase [Stellaceae bacterium]